MARNQLRLKLADLYPSVIFFTVLATAGVSSGMASNATIGVREPSDKVGVAGNPGLS